MLVAASSVRQNVPPLDDATRDVKRGRPAWSALFFSRLAPLDALRSDARPALDEVDDQDDHSHNYQDVDESAADIGKQPEQPENGDDDGYPKQHVYLLRSARMEILRPARSSYGVLRLRLLFSVGTQREPLQQQVSGATGSPLPGRLVEALTGRVRADDREHEHEHCCRWC